MMKVNNNHNNSDKRPGRPEKKIYSRTEMEEILEKYINDEVREVSWLSDEDYQKAVGQLKLQLTGVFEPFNMYGQHVYISPAIEEVTRLCEDFGLRVRGIDKAISLEIIRSERRFVFMKEKESEKEYHKEG